MSKKVKIVFTLSFLLNVLLIGVLLGCGFKMNKWHQSFDIDSHTRQVMKKNMDDNRADMRENFEKIRKLKDELKVIMTAEQFDRASFQNKMDQILEVKNTISDRKTKTLANTLSELSKEERQKFSPMVLNFLMDKRSGRGNGHHYFKDKK